MSRVPTATEKLNVALVELTLELNEMALAAALAADELAFLAFVMTRDSVATVNEILEKLTDAGPA